MNPMRLSLTPWHRLLLGLVAAAALLVLLVRWVYLPVVGRLRDRAAAIHELRVKLADAQGVLPRLPAQDAAFQETRARFDAFQARLGTDEALASILDTLRREAERWHLEFRASQLPTEDAAERAMRLGPALALRPVPVALNLAGRYRSLGEFLGSLERLPAVVAIETLSVSHKPDLHPRLEATVRLAVYLLGRS
ncbi:MAG: type 4a pilus biogenesis protein PilO [Candidatus Omnitrophica bacterium]|nr:type 4a pilus biogenesis protein PilO [Candidatus Omnitrophota bacterium]